MDVELKTDQGGHRLNNSVAITVVLLSVFMALAKIKDDNVVQAMQADKADMVDTWNEYQAQRLKREVDAQALAALPPPDSTNQSRAADLRAAVAHYDQSSAELSARAKGFQADYDTLNIRDDQFDLSDAGAAISLSLAAVSALTGLWWLIATSWAFGALGLLMGLAGFFAWPVHPNWLVSLLT